MEDKENKDTIETRQSTPDNQDQQQDERPADIPLDSEETVATKEDVEAFMRERRKARAEKKTVVEKENPEVEEYLSEENQIDPYLDPDPEIPWVKYEEPAFLSRGCRRCPKCYVPVSQIERQSCSKVTSTNWLSGIRQPTMRPFDCVEVRFKNNQG